jgi:hypothetical protein
VTSLKTDLNIPTESNKKEIIFVGILKVADEKSRIWNWIRIRKQVYLSKDPAVAKCHGSGTSKVTLFRFLSGSGYVSLRRTSLDTLELL